MEKYSRGTEKPSRIVKAQENKNSFGVKFISIQVNSNRMKIQKKNLNTVV